MKIDFSNINFSAIAFWGFCSVAIWCIAKCVSENSKNDNVIEYGYNYNVVKLNDSVFLLNPTYKNKDAEPKLVTKDSIGFYINDEATLQYSGRR